jgi:N-acetyl-gamma-glutamylphosphate reductase
VAARDGALVVTVAIDNLVKGAAGGGVQWMNRMLGLDQTSGLLAPGLGWI